MKLQTVFPALFERGVAIEPLQATEDVVAKPDHVAIMRERGIEPAIALQEKIKEKLISVLSDQGNPDWWLQLRPENVLQSPELSQWERDPHLRTEVENALREVASAAAVTAWNTVTGEDFEAEFEIADFRGQRSLDQQLHKLSQIASKEIGGNYTKRQFDEPSEGWKS